MTQNYVIKSYHYIQFHFDITLVNNIVYLPCMNRLDLFVKVKSFEVSGDRS